MFIRYPASPGTPARSVNVASSASGAVTVTQRPLERATPASSPRGTATTERSPTSEPAANDPAARDAHSPGDTDDADSPNGGSSAP